MKFLIVGLGNPGEEYSDTRHNIGFKALDFVSEQTSAFFNVDKLGHVASYKHRGRTILLLKPSTFMNLSGKAVSYWMKKEKIKLQNLLVVTDDINLPMGKLRLKKRGSDGGHNGLKNIQELLGTQDYARLRIGVGNEFKKGNQVNYVLGKWTIEEKETLNPKLNLIQKIFEDFSFIGVERTMNSYNNK